MEKSSKTTIFMIAVALASSSDAFVSQSKTPLNVVVGGVTDTKLNALWRNWVPQTNDFMDLMVGEQQEQQNREFIVVEPLDENDVGVVPSTVSLVSQTKDDSAANSNRSSQNSRSPGFGATTLAATLLVGISCAFVAVPASLAVSGGGLDFAGLDISNKDFSKGNYKGKDFTQVLARNTNFSGSNLAGCRFPKAYLINANYEGADIRGVSFEGTNMEDTNLKVRDYSCCCCYSYYYQYMSLG
jgi:uncharacterized protein YjbI with pentapeptide repeats